ncbi:unnamed protein product, partial [Meganyctiphanes norvegica]
GDSLVLQNVDRRRAGRYRCAAVNSLAAVTSDPVRLNIRYQPECQTAPTTFFIYDRPINITCTVASYPPVTSVLWRWNSSDNVLSTQPITDNYDQVTAQLTVHPSKSKEDRILSCWAENEMGEQTTLCKFSVKLAKMPAPLSSCRLANITASSLSLTCERPDTPVIGTTMYRAEVYLDNDTLFANVTSPRPSFNVSRLDADTSYQIKVYVSHGPVTSQPVLVSGYTSRTQRREQENISSEPGNMSAILGGIILSLGIVVLAVWAQRSCMRRGRRRRESLDTQDTNNKPASTETTPLPTTPSTALGDSNPDIVPNIEETYNLLTGNQSKPPTPSEVSMFSLPETEKEYT